MADGVELPVGLGLDRLILEHRLGDEVAIGERVERHRRGDARERERLFLVLVEAALNAAVERAAEPFQRRRQLRLAGVGETHLVTGEREYLRFFRAGSWHGLSWTQMAERARRVACGLIAAGLKPGDYITLPTSLT